jgi:hypothetical protein
MPKVNVYLPEAMHDWLVQSERSPSQELQRRLMMLMAQAEGHHCQNCAFFEPLEHTKDAGFCTLLPKWERVREEHYCAHWEEA